MKNAMDGSNKNMYKSNNPAALRTGGKAASMAMSDYDWFSIDNTGPASDPALDTLQIRFMGGMLSELDPRWNRDHLPQPFHRLYYVEAGGGAIFYHGHKFELKPGQLYLIPAQTAMRSHCPDSVTIHWRHFTAVTLGGISLLDYLDFHHEARANDPAGTESLFRRLHETGACRTHAEAFEARGLLMALLAPLMAATQTAAMNGAPKSICRFRRTLQYIEENLHRDLSVEELARTAHLQEKYFSTLFRESVGEPPMRHVTRRRIERAQQMLRSDGLTLAEAAQRLGFGDAFHLSRTFKKITGLSPRDFRRKTAIAGP